MVARLSERRTPRLLLLASALIAAHLCPTLVREKQNTHLPPPARAQPSLRSAGGPCASEAGAPRTPVLALRDPVSAGGSSLTLGWRVR